MSRPDRAAIADSSTVDPEPVDLLHLGRPRVICAWLLGEVIVDPGPASCLPALLDALGERVPRALALTHIHLDHAGAAGSLARRFPGMEVWVHERGARHLADPSRLLASASRLYGAEMDRLWGEVLPVPAERIRVLSGGETLAGMTVAYTPGHASHHVSYLHEQTGWAFTGDVAGVRIAGGPTMAPTPPPDIDLKAWRDSLELIEGWQPSALAITHFGAHRDVAAQLEELRRYLGEVEGLAATLEAGSFAAAARARVAAAASGEIAATYEQAMPPEQSYAGLRRALERA
ncbi:MAG: beta-lactamase domain protein [Solirubrobacterales bacterium]|nr:beta-lactamase domain protein [Solirubrobacterales bacterium]